MYVLPFWSYRPIESGFLIKNHLERHSFAAPAHFVDALAGVYETGAPPDDASLAMATDHRILFASKDAADEYVSALAAYQTREVPFIDQIEMTNRCPYTCPMCPRTVSMTRDLGDMKMDLFQSIITQVAERQRYLALHHFGESLVHKHLPDAVAFARDMRVRTALSCNPPSLRPALAEQLLKSGIVSLLLSQDSLDPETYRGIRGRVARAGLADTHIRELVRLRDEGGYDTAITLQMINMEANKSEADRFIEYCAEVGVDRGVVIRLGRWDFEDEYIDRIGEVTAPGYTAPCSLPWSSMVVLWDGRVVPCCHDYDGHVVLGDLSRNTLDEIWQDKPAREFRARNEESQFCRKCAFSKWFKEQQREREGFRFFHRERAGEGEERSEWINPESAGWRDGITWFNRFDVLTGAAAQ
ncbi:radical SAM protein [Catellatospora sp. NPDC049609]|uniref:radical SAM/SPASM domain-containing protein n=1 Tax=Catellatospora sp. NPDC049609 TaxID=3155505 RepID=UPI00343168EA